MANRNARKRAVRRDRRKAKASSWRRDGKRAMTGNRIGHGQGGTQGTVKPGRSKKQEAVQEQQPEPLKARLFEMAKKD